MEKNANHWQVARIAGLRRFAIAITVLNVLGHTLLGFEQSYAQPLVALLTTYSLEFLLELIDAHCTRRKTRFGKGIVDKIDFFLSAHITALAVAMLIYANERLWVVSFAAAVAISSPFMGGIADHAGIRKRMLGLYTALGIAAVLAFTLLDTGMAVAGFAIALIANFAFEGGVVFYNAYLPDIAPR